MGRLEELFARGQAAHPKLGVEGASFEAHLHRCGADLVGPSVEVHAEDLYLACACLAGNVAAVAELRQVCEPVVARYLRRVGKSAAIQDEVEQRLWDALLVGGAEGPKLATYAGRGPLGGWIGVSAQRIALMILRHERAESRARHEVAARGRLVSADPEMAVIKDRYRSQFQEAIDGAIAKLDDRDKTIYRMHLVEGATLERIAKAYAVSHPTIIRWLEKARQRILEEVKLRLKETLPITSAEFDSIARLLVSQLDLDISRVLSKTP